MSSVEQFWSRCKEALDSEPLGDRYTVRRLGNTAALSRDLLGMITRGEKTGGFSRPEDLPGGTPPAQGDYVIFTDFEGVPRCLVRIEECRRMQFREIGAEQTACESEAARDPEVWRDIHRRYWTPMLAAEGRTFSEEMPVIFQRFRLLYSEP
jgi:uncharacterized protein YhfF